MSLVGCLKLRIVCFMSQKSDRAALRRIKPAAEKLEARLNVPATASVQLGGFDLTQGEAPRRMIAFDNFEPRLPGGELPL
jgi:hypothetical protein